MAKWHKAHGVFVECKVLGHSDGDVTIEVDGEVKLVPAHQIYDEHQGAPVVVEGEAPEETDAPDIAPWKAMRPDEPSPATGNVDA